MSSSRLHDVVDCSLEDLSQNPWSPYATADEAFACSKEYDHGILCYAERHNLHAETLKRIFTTDGPCSPLYELYISADALGDENLPGILKGYCDILGPVLTDKACHPSVQQKRVKEQRESSWRW